MDLSIQAIMQKVAGSFDPERAAGLDAKVQLHLTGSQGGDWVVTIRDQNLSVEPGNTPDPTLVFGADSQDVFDVFTGKINPMQAYLQGKVQFEGDIKLAMRLASLFRRLE